MKGKKNNSVNDMQNRSQSLTQVFHVCMEVDRRCGSTLSAYKKEFISTLC